MKYKPLTDDDWKNFGYESKEPCNICGNTDTKLEPRFCFATCREHASIPPVYRASYIVEYRNKRK